MKTVVAAMVTCIALFGLSLGATQFLLAPEDPSDLPEVLENIESGNASDAEGDDKYDAQSVPVAFRPNSVSVEAVVQMSDSIRKMEKQLRERENAVKRDEHRIKVLFSDLEREREELGAFSEGIDAKVESLQRLSNSLTGALTELNEKKTEIEKLEKKSGTDEQSQQNAMDEKVSHVKGWFEGLAPEQAADYLKEFANNGKLEFAASLLNRMPDRQKSKILGSMSDPVLVDQLIDALSTPTKK